MKIKEKYTKEFDRPKTYQTWSGLPIKELYNPTDMLKLDYNRDLGDAGEYPHTRGIYRNMYRGRIWTMRIGEGLGTPRDTNKQFKIALKEGSTGFNVFRDAVSVNGIDPDHPVAHGEIGLHGVSVASLQDMEEMFDDIPIDKISTNVLCASTAGITLLSLYFALAEKRGIELSKLRGTLSNDTLLGSVIYQKDVNPPDFCLKNAVDVIEFCIKYAPKWYSFYVSWFYNLRDWAYLTAAEEIAQGVGIAMAYVDAAQKRGLNFDDYGHKVSFYCNAGMDIFEEACKLRALRRMWARITRERFKATNPDCWKAHIGIHTSGTSTTRQQPMNNVVRAAYELLAGVLGGAQSLHACTFLEPLSLGTELAIRTAIRTQEILAYETGVTNVADPLGGSYYVETLTNKIEEEATRILAEIEDNGGMVEAIKKGLIDQRIKKGHEGYLRKIKSSEHVMVGLNAFQIPPEEDFIPGGTLVRSEQFQRKVEEEQISRIKKLRENRDNTAVKAALEYLSRRVKAGENPMRPIIEAAKVYATLEEMQSTLREALGYQADPFEIRRLPTIPT